MPPKLIISTCRNILCLSGFKISTSSLLFLEILQRYCKLVTLGALGMPGYGHRKQRYQIFIVTQKIHLTPHLFHEIVLRYSKLVILKVCYIESLYSEHRIWSCPPKNIVSTCRKLNVYLHVKYQLPRFFLEILILQSD